MLQRIKYEVVAALSKLEIATGKQIIEQQQLYQQSILELQCRHPEVIALQSTEKVAAVTESESIQPFVRTQPKVRRNESCPCGSGRKYKQCHGKLI